MARRTPPRYRSGPKKGQFKPRSSRGGSSRKRRRNPPKRKTATTTRRRRTTAKRAAPRRRVYRRNAKKLDVLGMLKDGVMDAAGIIAGEVGARTLPTLLKLPKQGAVGLGVQALSAVALGYGADRFVNKDVGRMVLAGALAAPMKTFIVSKNVPFLAPALSPAAQSAELGAYAGWGLSGYNLVPRLPQPAQAAGVAGYVPSEEPYNFDLHD